MTRNGYGAKREVRENERVETLQRQSISQDYQKLTLNLHISSPPSHRRSRSVTSLAPSPPRTSAISPPQHVALLIRRHLTTMPPSYSTSPSPPRPLVPSHPGSLAPSPPHLRRSLPPSRFCTPPHPSPPAQILRRGEQDTTSISSRSSVCPSWTDKYDLQPKIEILWRNGIYLCTNT